MTGRTFAHAAFKANLLLALRSPLTWHTVRPLGSDLKIEVDGRSRFPDAFVVCTPVVPNTTVMLEAVVVFEILSVRRRGSIS